MHNWDVKYLLVLVAFHIKEKIISAKMRFVLFLFTLHNLTVFQTINNYYLFFYFFSLFSVNDFLQLLMSGSLTVHTQWCVGHVTIAVLVEKYKPGGYFKLTSYPTSSFYQIYYFEWMEHIHQSLFISFYSQYNKSKRNLFYF